MTLSEEAGLNNQTQDSLNQPEVAPVRDIEKWKRLEKELRRSETKYRTLYNSTSDAVMLLDDRGFFDCNDATIRIFGCKDKAEFCTKHPADLSPPEQPCGTNSLTLANQRIAVAMKKGSNRFEWVHKRLDTGKTFPAEVLLNAMELSGRRVLQAVVRDITKRRRVEKKLVRAQETAMRETTKLRSMIEGMDEGVAVAGADDVITDVNDWFLDKVGLKRWDIVDKSLWDLLPHAKAAARIRGVLDRFRNGRDRKTHVVHRELLGMDVSLRVQPVFRNGRYHGVILNVIDVTDLVEARKAAEAANHAKSSFLANMSHEIRTPMTAILGFTDILLNEIKEPAALEAAEIVKRNGQHLLELINDILDLSKIEAGKMEFERICWWPRQVVTEVVSLLHVRAHAKGLALVDEYEGPLPETIVTDPTRLQQILINVVGNAIKFTETGGVRIVVSLADGGGDEPKLRFDVIDTGIGIPKEQIDNVFEAFSQGDGSATRQYGGTGLGLAISRQLARKLGGDVTAASEPGKGSTFTVTVATGPLRGVPFVEYAMEAVPGSEEPNARAAKDEGKLECRVLLAEDIPDNQRLIAAVLREAGAEVAIAQDGQEALEKALATQPGRGRRYSDPEEPFDVILMDMQMPALDGYEATRRLREQGYAGPIIALTAHAMRGDRRKCLDAGCDDYLTKPIRPEKLVATVAGWASRLEEDDRVDSLQGDEP
ncbi:MAG: ATP-binding protein [Planctomycetota bacterium]